MYHISNYEYRKYFFLFACCTLLSSPPEHFSGRGCEVTNVTPVATGGILEVYWKSDVGLPCENIRVQKLQTIFK